MIFSNISAKAGIRILLLVTILILLQKPFVKAGNSPVKITLNGYVKESGTKEPLAGVTVAVPSLQIGTITNTEGFYSLTFSVSDTVEVYIYMTGYKPVLEKVYASQGLDILLVPDVQVLEEVIISMEDTSHFNKRTGASVINVPIQQIKDMPALMGEKDVMKTLQLMPGVQKGREGATNLYVRGGGPEQNLILLDGASFYNVGHLWGFVSLFDGSMLKGVEFTKGGFPARFGGRLSSVVDMQTKDGSKESYHGEASISLISAKLFAEGPIKKNKASFIVSARRSYLDLLVTPFLPDDKKAGYYFYDVNAKINAELSRKDKLIFSTFLSRDKFTLNYHEDNYRQKTKIKWGTSMVNLKWNHLFTEKLFATTSLIFQNFKLGAKEHYSDIEAYKKQTFRYYTDLDNATAINDFSFRYDVEYKYSPSHDIKAGLITTYHRFVPVASKFSYATDTSISKKSGEGTLPRTEAVESAIYLEDTYKPHARIVLNAGLRISQFAYNSKSFTNAEPRLSLIVHLHPKVSIKGSWAIMNQYIHLLNQYTAGPPVDMWIPATGKLKPMKSQQASAGLLWEPDKKILLQLEGYYKKNSNIIDYKTGTSYIDIEEVRDGKSWEKIVDIGKGWAYGMEFSATKSKGKFTGFLSYTLSWNFVQFDSINQGKKFYARYDRRHDLSIALFYKLNSKIKLSAVWVYATGNSITLPVGMYHVPGGNITSPDRNPFFGYNTLYSDRNGYRMPSYHRMDLGVQFHKKKEHWERTWEVNIYNVYNRMNVYYYFIVKKGIATNNSFFNEKPEGYYQLKKLTLFPLLPSISYKISF